MAAVSQMMLLAEAIAAGGGGGTHPLDGLSPTAAWSLSRNLLSAFAGTKYTTASGVIDAVNDQSGNGRDMGQATATLRPTPTIAGPNSILGIGFDGIDDRLRSSAVLSSFISASTGYMIATIYVDSFPTNSATSYLNSVVMLDASQFAGITVRSGNILYAYNWDGNEDKAQGSVVASTAYVVEWRHEGGNIYVRVNGVENVTPVASGNTQTLTGVLQMGDQGSGTQPFAGKIFEAATFSSVPTLSQRDALVQDLGHWVGASV